MKHIKTFESYNNVNEEFIGSLLAAAKGVFKNFLNALAAPFKNFKEDFKRGMKREELKIKIKNMLDNILKASTDNINKAEDETAIIQIKDAFSKELDEQIIGLDNEVKTIKESLILESLGRDTLIGGRVLLNVVKTKIDEIKDEYDKKFAAAKDLDAKKQAANEWIKKVVEDSKKKMLDDKYIDGLIEKYKADNNIKTDTYKVGDNVIYLRKGRTKAEWDALSADQKKDPNKTNIANIKQISKINGDNYIFVGKDGKEITKKAAEIIGKTSDMDTALNNGLKDKLGAIKDDADKMEKVDKFVDFVSKEENKDKLPEIEKIIGGTEE